MTAGQKHYYRLPGWLANATAYISPLIVSLIVSGFVLGTVRYSSHRRWTP